MTEIIAENPQNTSPSLAERLAAMRADLDKQWIGGHEPIFSAGERATMKNWSLQKRLNVAIKNLKKRKIPAVRTAAAPRVAHRGARARRSPASQRRATTDSGGDPEPEPPRRSPYNSLPARRDGGAA